MRARFVSAAAIALLLGGGLLVQQSASAATYTCTSVFSGTTSGGVVVPSGATCNLQGATVNGTVSVAPGGRLISGSDTVITGGVSASHAGTDNADPFASGAEDFSVIICNTTISGPVSISYSESQVLVGGTSSSGGGCGGNNIAGSVTLSYNQGPVTLAENSPNGDCNIKNCHIGGSVSISYNKIGPVLNPPVVVLDNKISGGLSCSNNGDISGSNNSTGGPKTGQCAGF
jgi:hypothetical protein